jgi:lysyl-tRNA synthetase class 1
MRGSETSVWGTRFGPSASGTRDDGKPFYVPDIATADADFVCHWSSRANEMTHPILKARYADLVWDAGQPSRGSAATISWRGSPQTHTSTVQSPSRSKTFLIVAMPFDPGNFQPNLATQNVRQRQGLILTLHREGLTSDGKLWWMAYDFFDRQRGALSDEEGNDLIADLEQILLRFSDVSVPCTFDPQIVKHAAQHLIKHYTRLRRPDDVRRLYQTVARATEHHAALSDAMLAYVLLQESLDFYKQAGL